MASHAFGKFSLQASFKGCYVIGFKRREALQFSVWLGLLLGMVMARWLLGNVVEAENQLLENTEILLILFIVLLSCYASMLTKNQSKWVWLSIAWLFVAAFVRELGDNDWQFPAQMLKIATESNWRHGFIVIGSVLLVFVLLSHRLFLWRISVPKIVASSLPVWGLFSILFSVGLAEMSEKHWFHTPYDVFLEEFFEITGYYLALCGVWNNRFLLVDWLYSNRS